MMMQNDVKQVDRYLKMKRGLYYRPDNQGYTGLKSEAGRYPYDPASLGDGITILHEDNADEFSPACWPETKLAAKDAEIAALQARVAELEGVALIEVPISDAVTGGEYLSLMKHGWISGQWDNDDKTLSGYYWQSMEWWPHRLFQLPKIEEPTQ